MFHRAKHPEKQKGHLQAWEEQVLSKRNLRASLSQYCCQLKVLAGGGMHNACFQLDAARLVQEGCVMHQDDDEERMFPCFRIGQAQEIQVLWFCSAFNS